MGTIRKTAEAITRSSNGLTATYFSPTTTDTYIFRNDGRTFLHVKKTGAGTCAVTAVTPQTVDGLAIADLSATVPATTGDKFIGPFPPDKYNDGNGDCSVTFGEVTGLTCAVIRLP